MRFDHRKIFLNVSLFREFEAYMDEVKRMPGILGQNLSKRELMSHFRDYIGN